MIDKLMKHHGLFKDIAKGLSDAGYTVEVRYKGGKLVTVGKQAEPSLFGALGDVEINDMDAALALASDMELL